MSFIPDHPYRMLVIGGSGSGKTNALLTLIRQQDSDLLIDNICLYAKDLDESKYQLLIKKREEAKLCLNKPDPRAFIVYSNTMNDVYNNTNHFNSKRKRKILSLMTWLLIYVLISTKHIFRCSKLNIYLVFITQYYLSVPKNVRVNSARYLIMKIKNKRELQNIAIKHSADIHLKDFTRIFIKWAAEPHSFLIDYTTLPADNPLRLWKNVL